MIDLKASAMRLNEQAVTPCLPVEVLSVRARRIRVRRRLAMAATLCAVAAAGAVVGVARYSGPTRRLLVEQPAGRRATSTTMESAGAPRDVTITECQNDSVTYRIYNAATYVVTYNVIVDLKNARGDVIKRVRDGGANVPPHGFITRADSFYSDFPATTLPNPVKCAIERVTRHPA
jgi:hypothetical protein